MGRTCTITFDNKEDKTDVITFLLHQKLPFKGIDIDTIMVQKYVHDILIQRLPKYKSSRLK